MIVERSTQLMQRRTQKLVQMQQTAMQLPRLQRVAAVLRRILRAERLGGRRYGTSAPE